MDIPHRLLHPRMPQHIFKMNNIHTIIDAIGGKRMPPAIPEIIRRRYYRIKVINRIYEEKVLHPLGFVTSLMPVSGAFASFRWPAHTRKCYKFSGSLYKFQARNTIPM
jgi:hypothetical protein